MPQTSTPFASLADTLDSRQRPARSRVHEAAPTLRILLVDRHCVVREGLRAILGRASGLKVAGEAGDGASALDAFRRLRPDLVILDPHMPGPDEKDLLRCLLQVDPWARILVLSPSHTDADLTLSFARGARGYLLKSNPGRELVKAVRSVAKGERHVSSEVASRLLDRPNSKALSARKLEILDRVAQGDSTEDIVLRLEISLHTLKAHFTHIFEKLGTKDRAQALVEAVKRGLVRIR